MSSSQNTLLDFLPASVLSSLSLVGSPSLVDSDLSFDPSRDGFFYIDHESGNLVDVPSSIICKTQVVKYVGETDGVEESFEVPTGITEDDFEDWLNRREDIAWLSGFWNATCVVCHYDNRIPRMILDGYFPTDKVSLTCENCLNVCAYMCKCSISECEWNYFQVAGSKRSKRYCIEHHEFEGK